MGFPGDWVFLEEAASQLAGALNLLTGRCIIKSNMQMVWTLPITTALVVRLTDCGGVASERRQSGLPQISGQSGEHAEGGHAGGEKGHHAGGHRVDEIEHFIKGFKLSDMHPLAQHIAQIAKRLFELARKSGCSEAHWQNKGGQPTPHSGGR